MVHPKHYFLKTNMSPGLSCQSFEDAIVSKLRPRSVAMAAVATGSQQQKSSSSQLFFIDDLNCASVDSKTGRINYLIPILDNSLKFVEIRNAPSPIYSWPNFIELL